MRIVVTGASGFLGQAVLNQLAHRDVQVIGVARRPGPGLHSLAHYGQAPRAEVLVHLAQTNDRHLVNAVGAAHEAEMDATLVALLAAGPARVVFGSSAVLYGDGADHAHGPDDPIHATDSYTRIKAAAERRVLGTAGVAGAVARLVNLYGPGMARGNVLSHILAQIPGNGALQVFDDSPVRDFLWIDDAARALVQMALGQACGVFNVGTGAATSIRQLAQTALAAAGQADRAVRSTQPSARASHLVVDPSRTQQAFGWSATTPLASGLRQLLSIPQHSTP